MGLFKKIFKINDKVEPDGQTIYFKNGQMYKVYPSDKESWYDARFLISDGIKYDLEDIEDLKKIPVPNFSHYTDYMTGYGVTGSLDYVLRMKAGSFYNREEKELCSACLWKSTELMLANTSISWTKKDYQRLVIWHYELGLIEEAEKAQQYLNTFDVYTQNSFDLIANSIKDSVFSNSKKYHSDLVVFDDHGSGCCSECAKYTGRVYSISGKNKNYPALPEYAKLHGNFHPGCRCSMSLYFEGNKIYYKGKEVNAKKASNRPWIDDRTDHQKKSYDEYLKNNLENQKKEKLREINKREYALILEKLPEIAPKSYSGYVRMKNSKSKNFINLSEAAAKQGICIQNSPD